MEEFEKTKSIVKREVPPQFVGKNFQKGRKRTGGMPKGWKSTKTVIRELLQEMSKESDGEKITELQAILKKQIDIAKSSGDLASARFVLEQAGDLIKSDAATTLENANFFNIENIKQIFNKPGFLEVEDSDAEIIEQDIETEENENN